MAKASGEKNGAGEAVARELRGQWRGQLQRSNRQWSIETGRPLRLDALGDAQSCSRKRGDSEERRWESKVEFWEKRFGLAKESPATRIAMGGKR